MKRVYCLYRVSTKKQVDRKDKDEHDIPMQKKACHLFKRIEVVRGYQIKAELNMIYKQFCYEWSGSDLIKETIG